MHLGYLIPEFPGQTHAFFWREAQALTAQGFTVHFLSTRKPKSGTARHPFMAEALAQTTYLMPPAPSTVPFLLRHPIRLLNAIRYIISLHQTPIARRAPLLGLLLPAAQLVLTAHAQGVRHLHIHSFANAAHVGALGHILDGMTYSLTLHGDLDVYGRDHAAKLARASLVTTVTKPLADQVRQISPGSTPQVISMGVDVDRFTPAQRTPQDPIRITSIARLGLVKGHSYLLDAMARLVGEGHDLHYTIAGDGPHRDAIKDHVARLNLTARVTFTGPIGEDAVLALLQQTDIFALTSFGLGEAAPVAVMEAMACGLAVICSRIGGTGDMIADGQDGLLVAQQDVDAITDALRHLATDPALRSRLGLAARITAIANFDYRTKAALLGQAIRDAQTKTAPPA